MRGICKNCKKVVPSSKLILTEDGTPICSICRPIAKEEVLGYKPKKKKVKKDKT